MLIPSTERLRAPSGRPCGCSRWRWSMVSPSGSLVVEEPACLMSAATPLLSNGLYRWRFLMSLLMARSCWVEQAVKCLLKARAIAFGLECFFPSTAIEIFGGNSTSCLPAYAVGTSGAVGGFQQGPPLVLRFLADVPLDVLSSSLMAGSRGLSMRSWSPR